MAVNVLQAVASEISRLSGDGELCGSPFHDDSAQENLDLAALGTGSSQSPVPVGPSVMETWILLVSCCVSHMPAWPLYAQVLQQV